MFCAEEALSEGGHDLTRLETISSKKANEAADREPP